MEKKNDKPKKEQRRRFIKGAFGIGGIMLGSPMLSFMSAPAAGAGRKQKEKLGIALVGLGNYSTNQLAPALQETKNCYLAGIVTGTPSKIDDWTKKYDIPQKNVYNYENFDEIANNDDIDIVYVVLPNAIHPEFVIRAAKAKKNVICEKPMATNVEDAQKMLDACNENGVRLAIGYRLHFEPFNKRVMEFGQQQVFGKVKSITANNSSDMTSNKPNIWRLDKELAGGGPLMDLGIYAVQGAVYTMGKPPVAVTAAYGEVTKPLYFHDVEQSIHWELEFEDGVKAQSNSSYAEEQNELSAEAENGWWKLSPAYAYEGKKGETSEGKMDYPNIYEQVKQMDSQAASFRKNEKSIVPGEMGVRDMKILMAIYESADAGGKRVEIQY
ncbi:Gfo/Idh/MocA family oxidoreductase [Zunongwangia sp. F363]|uniref:Gfo/Idh/MocA family oxidoreductase n=1 Tax=Autumnicola tepida TaxID=3075595 RepID=A0ABU3C623_9FLAO|nr:Gfo/Idh/MocA family oxidoreductase [Zunongwangia sp. F363]MDT0641515.1 Gfo/Idh/MocA family oxidoreductase [Zunongwangia sp. F363]